MYLSKVQLKNIRSFEDTTVEFEPQAGWHVLLGDNGSGKSTLLRSIALGMISSEQLPILEFKEDWSDWLRNGHKKGEIQLYGNHSEQLSTLSFEEHKHSLHGLYQIVDVKAKNKPEVIQSFSAAYGSLRRLTGGSKDFDNVWKKHSRLSAHLTLFREDVALNQLLEWINNLLQIEEVSPDDLSDSILSEKERTEWIQEIDKASKQLKKISNFINRSTIFNVPYEFLVYDFRGLTVRFGNLNVLFHNLSDGYKSILALVLELLRQLLKFHNGEVDKVFSRENNQLKVTAPGIVLIDEVAAHLHPSWQARIGDWFTEYFPNIQFIVTTHSPIICRSAKKGSIQKIVQEGNRTIVQPISEEDRYTLLYGNILDAYETELFGELVSRSPEGLEKLERLAQLRVRKQFGQALTEEEKEELSTLLKIFPTDANHPFA